MKRAPFTAAVLLALSFAPAARAKVPEWRALPTGHVTSPPTTEFPASIGANEKAAGFSVGRAEHQKARTRDVVVSTNMQSACFSTWRRPLTDEEAMPSPDDAFPDWLEGLAAAARIDAGAGVTAVHREEVVEDGNGVRLESVDAWVDPKTGGVRRFATASLPLELVGRAIGGMNVYAAREERGGASFAQLVVVPKRTDDEAARASLGSLVAMLQSGGSVSSTGCGHLRVALAAGKHDGDAAVMTATVLLPSKGDEKTVRLRDASIQASISRMKSDPDPVLSVSFGWAARETTQRVDEDPGGKF